MSPPEAASLKFDDNQLPFIDLGTTVIRLEKEDPPEWALEKARNELRETPEVVEKAINDLRQLIQKTEFLHLPLDDEYMKMFLRPAKYYPDSALKRLTNFYHMKLKYGEVCDNILPCKIRNVFEEGNLILLPSRDQHGRRILVIDSGKRWKPSKVPLSDMFKGIQLAVLGSMVEPISQICGAIVIIDMEGLPAGHVMHFTPSFAIMLLDYIQDCICMRLKAVHIVNNSYIFNMLFAIFKPFIREKLRKRIFFHGKDWNSLANHIDRDRLPAQYGGSASWEMPPGNLLADFFDCYRKDFEMANTYGFTNGYKMKK